MGRRARTAPSKRSIEKLADEIAELDRLRRERRVNYDEDALTEAERAFCALADTKGKSAFRAGWPDFLVVDRVEGGFVPIEVKTHKDRLQPSQRLMFAALEHAGMYVMIWSPEEPSRLTPWRKWDQQIGGERGRPEARRWGPRQPVLGRTKERA